MSTTVDAFLYGIILAFGLIIPLGAQNIFLFNQGATQKHYLHALPSVIAASVADSLLILLAVLGVSVAVLEMPWLKNLIFIVGFCFLMYMSWIIWHSKPAKLDRDQKPLSAKKQVSFAFSISILNPHALIDTIGVIGTSSLSFSGNAKIAFTTACILVSIFWFFGLSIVGHTVHKMDRSGKWLTRLNKISAVIIFCVAIYIAWQLVNAL